MTKYQSFKMLILIHFRKEEPNQGKQCLKISQMFNFQYTQFILRRTKSAMTIIGGLIFYFGPLIITVIINKTIGTQICNILGAITLSKTSKLVPQFFSLLQQLSIALNKLINLFPTNYLLSWETLEVYNKLLNWYSRLLGFTLVLNSYKHPLLKGFLF